jgi:transposase InsO family protein
VADIRESFYKYQSSKQIFAPAPKYKGKIFSPGLDRRWAADIMVQAGKYTLIVQDIFSRYAWAEPIDSPMSASHGMEEVLRRAGKTPDELSTDADPGFQTRDFNELLSTKGIHHTLREGRNDIASVDRLISTIKRSMATDAADHGERSIASIVAGYNDSSHPRLMGGAPDDLRKPGGGIGNKIMYFPREEEDAKNIQQNTEDIKKRAAKLDEGFRVYKHKGLARPQSG